MSNDSQQQTSYGSLDELQLRKERILNEIRKNNNEIGQKWHSLFYNNTPGRKKGLNMATIVNTGTGLFDGFMLAWKLYNKFRR